MILYYFTPGFYQPYKLKKDNEWWAYYPEGVIKHIKGWKNSGSFNEIDTIIILEII